MMIMAMMMIQRRSLLLLKLSTTTTTTRSRPLSSSVPQNPLSSSVPQNPPNPKKRVAIVGGGIAGTLCSLVLRNKGGLGAVKPTIIDSGYQVGGRLRRKFGVQFIRATNPKLLPVLSFLERENLLQPWTGRFGLLGSKEGGFLPSEIVTQNTSHAAATNNNHNEVQQQQQQEFLDGGDFCHFVEGSASGPTYVGNPGSFEDLCHSICQRAKIDTMNQSTLVAAKPILVNQGEKDSGSGVGWELEIAQSDTTTTTKQYYDALVIATHNPSVAAKAIRSIVDYENQQEALAIDSNSQQHNDGDNATNTTTTTMTERLLEISNSLQNVRDNHCKPIVAIQLQYPKGFSKAIPFDAVCIPGSHIVQFLVKESSKTTSQKEEENENEIWTAITTSKLASSIISAEDDQKQQIEQVVVEEISKLLEKYFSSEGTTTPQPIDIRSYKWNAAFTSPGLQLKEDSIVLAPWNLIICGDYIGSGGAGAGEQQQYGTPLEAAALSGLEAGERMTTLLLQPQPQPQQQE